MRYHVRSQDVEAPSNVAVMLLVLLMPVILVWAITMGIWDAGRKLCR